MDQISNTKSTKQSRITMTVHEADRSTYVNCIFFKLVSMAPEIS